jgi:hypothetical protein
LHAGRLLFSIPCVPLYTAGFMFSMRGRTHQLAMVPPARSYKRTCMCEHELGLTVDSERTATCRQSSPRLLEQLARAVVFVCWAGLELAYTC